MTLPPPVKTWSRVQMVRLYRGEAWEAVDREKAS